MRVQQSEVVSWVNESLPSPKQQGPMSTAFGNIWIRVLHYLSIQQRSRARLTCRNFAVLLSHDSFSLSALYRSNPQKNVEENFFKKNVQEAILKSKVQRAAFGNITPLFAHEALAHTAVQHIKNRERREALSALSHLLCFDPNGYVGHLLSLINELQFILYAYKYRELLHGKAWEGGELKKASKRENRRCLQQHDEKIEGMIRMAHLHFQKTLVASQNANPNLFGKQSELYKQVVFDLKKRSEACELDFPSFLNFLDQLGREIEHDDAEQVFGKVIDFVRCLFLKGQERAVPPRYKRFFAFLHKGISQT